MLPCQPAPCASGLEKIPLDQIAEFDISNLLNKIGRILDTRGSRGKVYVQSYVLAITIVAMLAGGTKIASIARWTRRIPQPMLAVLGAPYCYFLERYRTPSEKVIGTILRRIDVAALDIQIGLWLFEQRILKSGAEIAIAIDGKVLRGAWVDEWTQVKLLSAMIHGEGLVVGQIRVPDDTNEITQIEKILDVLPDLPAETPVTADAAHTQIETAKAIASRNLIYLLFAKGNQKGLQQKIIARVEPLLEEPAHHVVEERRGGKIKTWETWVTAAEGIDFPHVETIGVIRRDVSDTSGRLLSREYALPLTNAKKERATAEWVHTRTRGHWGIENEIHYTRDTAWREDNDLTYNGDANHAMASVRNISIGIIRLNGINKIKETLEEVAADRTVALRLIATACNRSTR
jgi:predicted transposase YbfD/YdcC